MRRLHLRQIDRRTLDELSVEALVVSIGDVKRPPRGLVGRLDWRMNGFISRLMLAGEFSGVEDEVVLMDTAYRIPSQRVFLFGWNDAAYGDEKKLVKAIRQRLDVVSRAGFDEIALEVPYPATSLEMMVSWEKAIVSALSDVPNIDEIYLVVEPHLFEAISHTLSMSSISYSLGGGN